MQTKPQIPPLLMTLKQLYHLHASIPINLLILNLLLDPGLWSSLPIFEKDQFYRWSLSVQDAILLVISVSPYFQLSRNWV